MRFSDWQLNRLRDALRAYHKFGRDPVDGRHFNWKDVSEAIFLSAEVEVPPERLRQFVEGVKTPSGGRRLLTMQDDRLDAIAKFATDEDYGLISEAELREHAPSWHAAQRLLEYLKQDFDTERILPPSTLEGTYRNGRIDEDNYVVRELTLQRASDDGLIQLVQIEDSYDLLDGMQFDDFTPEKREEVREQPHRIWRLGNSYARGQPAHVPQEGAHWSQLLLPDRRRRELALASGPGGGSRAAAP